MSKYIQNLLSHSLHCRSFQTKGNSLLGSATFFCKRTLSTHHSISKIMISSTARTAPKLKAAEAALDVIRNCNKQKRMETSITARAEVLMDNSWISGALVVLLLNYLKSPFTLWNLCPRRILSTLFRLSRLHGTSRLGCDKPSIFASNQRRRVIRTR